MFAQESKDRIYTTIYFCTDIPERESKNLQQIAVVTIFVHFTNKQKQTKGESSFDSLQLAAELFWAKPNTVIKTLLIQSDKYNY